MQNRKTKLIIIILTVIIVLPIIYNRVKPVVLGIITAKMMNAPVKVETEIIENATFKPTVDIVGRIEEDKEISIVSRVDGWLQKKFFNDGDYVKKGQLLFQIEPDSYAIAVKNAEATLRSAQASYENSLIEMKRAKELLKGDYVSKSYYDQTYTKYSTDNAAVDAAKADLAKRKLDLSYTKIYAPFDGKIGSSLIDEGNYISAQTGKLAIIVTTNPIYATFTMKPEELKLFRPAASDSDLPDVSVNIRMSDGSMFEKTGKMDFIDNKIDTDSGTIKLRAVFENPQLKLIPNEFVRVILTSNSDSVETVVPQTSVLESINGKYVWMIDENGLAKQQNIEVSGSYNDFWVVTDGIKEGDKIISSNLQSLRQGVKVQEIQLSEEIKKKKQQAREDALKATITMKPNQTKEEKTDKAE